MRVTRSRASSCPVCAKLRYPTRKEANKAGIRTTRGTGRMRPYRCPIEGWHVGHMPAAIRSGQATDDACPRPNAPRHDTCAAAYEARSALPVPASRQVVPCKGGHWHLLKLKPSTTKVWR